MQKIDVRITFAGKFFLLTTDRLLEQCKCKKKIDFPFYCSRHLTLFATKDLTIYLLLSANKIITIITVDDLLLKKI